MPGCRLGCIVFGVPSVNDAPLLHVHLCIQLQSMPARNVHAPFSRSMGLCYSLLQALPAGHIACSIWHAHRAADLKPLPMVQQVQQCPEDPLDGSFLPWLASLNLGPGTHIPGSPSFAAEVCWAAYTHLGLMPLLLQHLQHVAPLLPGPADHSSEASRYWHVADTILAAVAKMVDVASEPVAAEVCIGCRALWEVCNLLLLSNGGACGDIIKLATLVVAPRATLNSGSTCCAGALACVHSAGLVLLNISTVLASWEDAAAAAFSCEGMQMQQYIDRFAQVLNEHQASLIVPHILIRQGTVCFLGAGVFCPEA
jgi:hypothetical protein